MSKLSKLLKVNSISQKLILSKSYPLALCKDILKKDTISVLGYGPQGQSQSLNLRDNNLNVILQQISFKY